MKHALIALITTSIAISANAMPTETAGGWIDVPLTDTSPFNPACDYRASFSDTIYGKVIYASMGLRQDSSSLYFQDAATLNSTVPGVYFGGATLSATDKTTIHLSRVGNPTITITSLQERCLSSLAPRGQIAFFDKSRSSFCPKGWSPVPASSRLLVNSNVLQCEKN